MFGSERYRSPLAAAAIALLAGGVYGATTATDIVVGDSSEFLTAAMTWGVAHPSGYPLLVILGRAFSRLPVGGALFGANLVAAVSSAGAVTLVFLTARQLGAAIGASALAALMLAFHPLFWEWSLALEAFPLNNLLAAGVLYFLVRWNSQPERTINLTFATFCFALGGADHLTIVCVLPAGLFLMWRHRHYLGWRQVAITVVAAFVGVVPYLYIPWAAARHPYLNWGDATTVTRLVGHFMRTDYGTLNLAPTGVAASPMDRVVALLQSFSIPEAALVVAGAFCAWRRVRWYFWSVLLVFVLAGPVFAVVANVDPHQPSQLWVLRRFFLLPHVAVTPLSALGAAWLLRILDRVAAGRRIVMRTAMPVAITVVLAFALSNYRHLDQRTNHFARTFGEDILASLDPHAVLLAAGEGVVFPLSYLQAVQHERPDVTVVAMGLYAKGFDWYVSDLSRRDPDLVVPPRPDGSTGRSLGALLEANPGRTFALVGEPQDDAALGGYWCFRRGLACQLEPLTRSAAPERIISENERLMGVYRVPDRSSIKAASHEASMLARYGRVAATLGDYYALSFRNSEAAAWYRRALAIDPGLTDARASLERLSPGGNPP